MCSHVNIFLGWSQLLDIIWFSGEDRVVLVGNRSHWCEKVQNGRVTEGLSWEAIGYSRKKLFFLPVLSR